MSVKYWDQIQRTIDYIEHALGEPLRLSELARHAGFSGYHFHRVFQMVSGDAVMDYVRKRRLAHAAYELSHTEKRVVDVAFTFGFGSHETFTRAFQKTFGMTPAEYRRRNISTPLFPKLNVQHRKYHSYLGGIRMDYKIVTKPAFKCIGYELRTTSQDGKNHREIPAYWQQYLKGNWADKIPNRVRPQEDTVELGICTDFNMETGEFSYIIGMEATSFDNVPEGLVCRTFGEQTYAVFTTPAVPDEKFSDSIQSTWMAIFNEWFPYSGYQHAEAPEFEWYDHRCWQDRNELLQMDIYIPIVKVTGQ